MYWFLSFVIALGVAILFFAVLYFLVLRAMAAEKRVGWIFLAFVWFALFLPTWAGGLWLRPIGPRLGGVPVLGYLAMGLVVALILAAVLPRPTPEPERSEDEPRLTREEVLEGQRQEEWGHLAWFFGIFFIFMVAMIVAGILFA